MHREICLFVAVFLCFLGGRSRKVHSGWDWNWLVDMWAAASPQQCAARACVPWRFRAKELEPSWVLERCSEEPGQLCLHRCFVPPVPELARAFIPVLCSRLPSRKGCKSHHQRGGGGGAQLVLELHATVVMLQRLLFRAVVSRGAFLGTL